MHHNIIIISFWLSVRKKEISQCCLLYTSDIYLLATAADEDESAIDGAIKGLEGWIACFEKCQLKGVIKGVGVDQYGEVNNHQELLEKAYQMGKEIV